MKKFAISTLLCIVCLLPSILFGTLIYSFTIQLVIHIAMSPGTIRTLLSILSQTAIICTLLYFSMRRNGYTQNKSYENNSLRKTLISIIISVLLLPAISMAINFRGIFSEGLVSFLWFLIRSTLMSIAYAFSMTFGYDSGYKIRETERIEILNKKGGR